MRSASFLRFSAIAIALVFSFNLVSYAANAGPSRPLITSAINDNNRVTLSGNTHPDATAKNDRGRVPDDFALDHLQLLLRRPAEQETALESYIEDLQKPGSASYHQWLTARQLGEDYGPARSDLDTIKSWLQGQGFKVNVVYASGMIMDFSGTAGMVRQAFQTEIHRLEVKGESHISNMSDPRIPAALAPAVMGIVSLNDFKPNKMFRPKSQYTALLNGLTYYAVVPGDLATIYNLNPLFSGGISGKGQTVVVLEDTDMLSVDWHDFRRTFALNTFTSGNLLQVNPPSSGTNNCSDPGVNGDSVEAAIDVEWSSAAAPDATIELASCADTTTFGGLIAIENLLNASATPPAIVSMSYGLCEAQTGASLKAAFNTTFEQAVSEGVSVFVSSGDSASAECDRPYPASFHGIAVTGWGETPYNVSVGGTDFGDTFLKENSTYWSSTNSSTFESALSYVPEIPWNDSCASQLISTSLGFETPYGSDGACNSSAGADYVNTVGGGGGPSECATGTPSIGGVVSGTCKGYAKPYWQSVFGNPSDGVRDTPDVSLFAANGVWGHFYVACISNFGFSCAGAPITWWLGGGTSFSSPILAGMQALVNQQNGSYQGNPNVAFYALADAEYGESGLSACNSTFGKAAASSCVFYDVTLGDNDVPCKASAGRDCYGPSGKFGVLSTSDDSYDPAYATGTGWDFATGIGTVNALNLVNQWSSVAPKAAGDK
jgi:subtilase family serine protease